MPAIDDKLFPLHDEFDKLKGFYDDHKTAVTIGAAAIAVIADQQGVDDWFLGDVMNSDEPRRVQLPIPIPTLLDTGIFGRLQDHGWQIHMSGYVKLQIGGPAKIDLADDPWVNLNWELTLP